jgi:PAS domain S-box-containing protein
MNILVVDDKKEGRYMLECLLKGSGHGAVCAENGIEALDMLKKNSIDIIISDILMPKMDGFAFCRECKRDDSLRKIPFIFYTATYTDKKDEEFALSLGADKFIIKPTETNKLLEILDDIVERYRKGIIADVKKPVEEEVYLVQYNKRLVEKLEQKNADLEKELDIRKQAELALRMSEQRFRAIADYTYSWELWISPNGNFLWTNPAAQRITGYSAEECTAMPRFPLAIVDDQDQDKAAVVFKPTVEAATGKDLEFRIHRKDGTLIWVSACWQYIYDVKGLMQGFRIGIRDITERKLAEEKLHDNQKRLKALASELTLAEERERRRIALGIHDNLGQKLVMVKFRLQAIKASVSERNMQTVLDNECIAMADILDDIHSLTFKLSNPLLYEIGFESAMKSWLKTEIQKTAGLKCEFTSEDKNIELDEDIKIVLFKATCELLINIVKHAGARNVKVAIAKRNDEVEVTVEDDGTGFDVSKLSLPSAKTGGFGLFSTKERLEYMGGRLEIESRPGKGTRVVMTAPVKKSEQGRDEVKLHESADSR